jgi:hypothetical protein
MIIGLGHKKNVGKDTFANFLMLRCKEYGVRVRKVSISDPLFNAANLLFGWAGVGNAEYYNSFYEQKDVDLAKLEGITPRTIAKGLANLCRSIDPDTMIKSLIASSPPDQITIITNMRFPNEAAYIRENHGLLIKIERPGIESDSSDSFDMALDTWEDWDHEVVNNGTLDDLAQCAKDFFHYINLERRYA